MNLFEKLVALALLPASILLAQTSSLPASQISSALRAGNLDQALHLADQALATSPHDPQLWALKGIALSAQKHSKEALDAYHQSLKLSPNYLPALEGAAQIEYDTGNAEAVTLLKRIAELRPADQTSHAMLASIAYKQGHCKDAVAEFEKSPQLMASEAGALQEYGACLLRLKQPDKAVAAFQQLLRAHPEDPRARRALATVQLATNQASESLSTLQPLVASGDVPALQLAASAHETLGETPEAVRLLRDAIVKDPRRISLYVDFANLALTHQSFDAGIEMMNSGLKLQPDAGPLYLARGVLYVQTGNFDKAEADFDKSEQLNPHEAATGIAQGLVAEEKHHDNPDDALAVVRSKLAASPHDPFLLYLEAAIIQQKAPAPGSSEFERGVKAAQRSVELQPSLASAHDVLANFRLQEGNTNSAIDECRAALRYKPDDQTALYRLIVALRKTGQKNEIPDLLKRLADARQKATKQEAENNRYKLVVNSDAPSN
jgi:tetratricopeptide (TPR) repeat protein